MSTKTISIDLEAYRRLKAARRDAESFSKVIKRVVRPRFDVAAYLDRLDAAPMGNAAVAAAENQVASRGTASTRDR